MFWCTDRCRRPATRFTSMLPYTWQPSWWSASSSMSTRCCAGKGGVLFMCPAPPQLWPAWPPDYLPMLPVPHLHGLLYVDRHQLLAARVHDLLALGRVVLGATDLLPRGVQPHLVDLAGQGG